MPRGVLELACAGVLLLCPLARAQDRAAGVDWVELVAPSEGAQVVSIPLVELRGLAGAGLRPPAAAVILIDVSRSSLLPPGFDVDRDGVAGLFRKRTGAGLRWSSDPDDTVLAAARVGAEHVIRRLARGETRVGLVSFGRAARLEAELGEPLPLLDVLPRLRVRVDEPETNLARALRRGLDMLARSATRAREGRWLVLFSDGRPTAPNPRAAAREAALRQAELAAREGVRICAYALGPYRDSVLDELAARTGGALVHVRRERDFAALFPWETSELTEVAFENRASGSAGVAVRLFADGSFDGFVRLVPGHNPIQVTGTLASGSRLHASVGVHFEPRDAASRAEMLDLLRLRRRVRARSRETELAIAARRPIPRNRSLEIAPERALLRDVTP